MNPFGINEPCINIAKNQLVFEQCRMVLNREKYDIQVQNDYAINCNPLLFDFMQRTFNRLDIFYSCEMCLLIEATMEGQMRKQGAAEIENSTDKLRQEIK